MRPSLDENTRSALHFTLLGLGLVGGARLAYWWIGRLLLDGHPGAAFLLPWRAGYLLADPYSLVDAAPALPLRLAAAVGYALLAGVLAAVLARAFRIPMWVATGRVPGVAILLLALFSALALPPHTATPDPSSGTWHLCTRIALPGGIAVPGTASCTILERDTVRGVYAPDVIRLTLDGLPLAEAHHTGVAGVDSSRAVLAAAVLNDRMGLIGPP